MRCRLKPFKQGDCDGLCGIYAIINAFAVLCPEINVTQAKALFRTLIAALPEHRRKPLSVVWQGMHGNLFRLLLAHAEDHVQETFSAQIKRSRLNLPTHRVTIRQLCECLREALEDDQVALLMIDGCYSHWTVAYRVTEKTIRLLNSTGIKYLLRSSCTLTPTRTGHRLAKNEIILLRRVS